MTIQEIAGLAADCGSGSAILIGDDLGCSVDLDKINHGFIFTKGFRIPLGTTLNDAYWLTQEQKGNVVPLVKGLFEFIPSEDSVTTNADNQEQADGLGLPKFSITFENSDYFNKQLAKLRSFKRYDFAFADINDTLRLADYGSEGYGGFDAGQVLPGMSNPRVAGAAANKKVTIQLVDRNQFDLEFENFAKVNHGITFRKHTGISPLKITYPSSIGAGTAVQIKVTLNDKKTPNSGLLKENLKTEVDGTNNVIVSATEDGTTGVYDMVLTTALVAGEKLVTKTHDATEGVDAVQLGTGLYKANGEETTIV